MLILSTLSSPLHCQSITGNRAIAALLNGRWLGREPQHHPLGNPDVVNPNPGDRIFRLIQRGSNLEPYRNSGRCRQSPEPT